MAISTNMMMMMIAVEALDVPHQRETCDGAVLYVCAGVLGFISLSQGCEELMG